MKSSKMRNRSYSPTKIEFHVSRFDGRMGGFKLTGRDLFRNGRWNWKRLESRIVDTALFDAKSGDELLINYKFSVYDMSELRLCSEEFESNSSNEILVVRTNEEGHYPEKVYEAMKEQQRQTRPSSGHQSRSFNGGILSSKFFSCHRLKDDSMAGVGYKTSIKSKPFVLRSLCLDLFRISGCFNSVSHGTVSLTHIYR